MKVDFKKFSIYPDIDTETPLIQDVSRELANAVYQNANTIQAHNLAMKIFNSTEETEISDEEKQILLSVCQQTSTGWFLGSLMKSLE